MPDKSVRQLWQVQGEPEPIGKRCSMESIPRGQLSRRAKAAIVAATPKRAVNEKGSANTDPFSFAYSYYAPLYTFHSSMNIFAPSLVIMSPFIIILPLSPGIFFILAIIAS